MALALLLDYEPYDHAKCHCIRPALGLLSAQRLDYGGERLCSLAIPVAQLE
jgi:hypothetical protein